MQILIQSLSSVSIDGKDSGSVVDVLANNSSDIRGPLLDALILWNKDQFNDVKAQNDAALTAKDADSQAALAALQATTDAALAKLQADTDAALAAKVEESIASVAELQAQADIAVAAFQTELSEHRSKFDAVEKKLLEPGVSIEEVKAEHDKTEKVRIREELLAKKAEIERQNAEELAAIEQKNADELAEINAAIAAANASPAPPNK